MKKTLIALSLCLPLLSFAQNNLPNLQTNNYRLTIGMSNEYDGPYKDEGVRGISEENRNGIYQQAGMFKSLNPTNQNKDAAGSAFLINSKTPLTSELLVNETLGWLLKDDLKVTQCPNFRFQDFIPTCYVRTLRNEVRDVSFVVYSAISPNSLDAIVLVGSAVKSVHEFTENILEHKEQYKDGEEIVEGLQQQLRTLDKELLKAQQRVTNSTNTLTAINKFKNEIDRQCK